MILDTQLLKSKYKDYSNINQKIGLETKKNNITRIKRGLYSTNINLDGPILANLCYGPSYLSFEFALSFYGLIPERVSLYTSAVFNKKNYKIYRTKEVGFEYRNIPSCVFPFGVTNCINENGMKYKIAIKEKALCDILYSKYPVRSIKDLKILLFDDLRIDEFEFMKLNFDFIISIADKYRSNSLYVLSKFLKELKNGNSN